MTRPDAVLRDASSTGQARGWVHRHPVADDDGVIGWQVARYADPAEAVKASKRCGPVSCSPECARARDKGHRGYVAAAS